MRPRERAARANLSTQRPASPSCRASIRSRLHRVDLRGVELDGRTHRARDGGGLPELALGAGRPRLVHRLQQGLEVLLELRVVEVALPERDVNNALLVSAELELASLELADSLACIPSDHGAGLRGGHQALRPEHLAELRQLG